METSAGQTARKSVIRSEPDTTREAVSTRAAADRLKLSRFYVAELVRQGKIDGYGIRQHERRRTRWYVYADALPDEPKGTRDVPARTGEQELLKYLLDSREHSRLARAERESAKRLLVDALDGMTAAVRAVHEGDKNRAFELLLAAQEIRNDEERRLIMAQRHEADAEACLDAAFRSLFPSVKSIDSCGREDVSSASSAEDVVPVALDPEDTFGNGAAV